VKEEKSKPKAEGKGGGEINKTLKRKSLKPKLSSLR
jgi:hypothetical protein